MAPANPTAATPASARVVGSGTVTRATAAEAIEDINSKLPTTASKRTFMELSKTPGIASGLLSGHKGVFKWEHFVGQL
jgi:hypothetical protein